jgi:hypothetical protein
MKKRSFPSVAARSLAELNRVFELAAERDRRMTAARRPRSDSDPPPDSPRGDDPPEAA